MIDHTKIESYREVYKEWKGMEQLEDFRYPKEKEHLDFSCIAGDTLIKFRLFTDKDLLQLRAEQQCAEKDDDKNGNRIREISQKYDGVFGTAYDGTAILNMSVPLTSVADDAAKKLVIEKSNEFALIIINEMADLSRKYDYKVEDGESFLTEDAADRQDGMKKDQVKSMEEQEPLISSDADSLISKEATYDTAKKETFVAVGKDAEDASISYTTAVHNPVSSENNGEEPNDFNLSPNMLDDIEDEYSDIFKEAEELFGKDIGILDDAPSAPDKIGPTYPEAQGNGEQGEMAEAVHRRTEQMEYRENILQEMRDLIEQDKIEAARIKQEVDATAEKNRKESERLKENWNKYQKSCKNLDKRTSTVAEREKKVMAKELELSQREEEISQREAELNAMAADSEEKRKELDREIDKNHNLLKSLEARKGNLDDREAALDTREKTLEIRQQRIEMDRKTVDDSIQDMYAMENMLKELRGKAVPVSISRYEERIKALEAEKAKITESAKMAMAAATAYKKRYDGELDTNQKLQEQMKKLDVLLKEPAGKQDNGELEKIKFQISDTRLDMQAAQRRADNAEKELGEMKEKNKELSEKLASFMREPVLKVLAAAGYPASPIAGEGNPLLTCDIDGCTVIIDEHLGIACMEKAVKRNYVKTFDNWNSQSFAETYSMSKGKAYCRFAYQNIADDSRRIAAKLNTLK